MFYCVFLSCLTRAVLTLFFGCCIYWLKLFVRSSFSRMPGADVQWFISWGRWSICEASVVVWWLISTRSSFIVWLVCIFDWFFLCWLLGGSELTICLTSTCSTLKGEMGTSSFFVELTFQRDSFWFKLCSSSFLLRLFSCFAWTYSSCYKASPSASRNSCSFSSPSVFSSVAVCFFTYMLFLLGLT